MKKLKTIGVTPEQFVKRAFFLLWKACRGPLGMGWLQDKGPDMTEEQVWERVVGETDYGFSRNRPNEPYGDYVFGRMMKWGCNFDNETVTFKRDDFNPDYQAWSVVYKDTEAIIDAVCKSLNCTIEYAN